MNASSQQIQTQDREETMVCPTCGAKQSWSDECRRCKCDLSDLRAIWRSGCQARLACLQKLRDADFDRAVEHGLRYHALQPGDDAARLLSTCYLLRGDWRQAYQTAARVIRDKLPARSNSL